MTSLVSPRLIIEYEVLFSKLVVNTIFDSVVLDPDKECSPTAIDSIDDSKLERLAVSSNGYNTSSVDSVSDIM